MTRHFCILILAFVVLCGPAVASDPAQALAAARAAIQEKEYQRASSILQQAIADANSITDAKLRVSALSAIHFYRALALSLLGDDNGARVELREFFRLHPGYSTLDPTKYSLHFIEIFGDENARATGAANNAIAFDAHYPGSDAIGEVGMEEPRLQFWPTTPDFQLLATDGERREWFALHDEEAQSKFLSDFWRRRDPDPSTAVNEWRKEFNRRVAFANAVFGGGSDVLRGALTDRGRVFVLLGKPAQVYTRVVTARDGILGFVPRTLALGSVTIERWIYFGDQLPGDFPKRLVEFRFLADQEHPELVLQRDSDALAVLAKARMARSGATAK